MEEFKGAYKNFVHSFVDAHGEDPNIAITMLVAVFTCCYGALSAEERFRTMYAIFEIVKDVASERFEDGNDFVSFLKEKTEERGWGKRL